MGTQIKQIYDEVEDEEGLTGIVHLIQETGIKKEEAMEADDAEKLEEVKQARDKVLA